MSKPLASKVAIVTGGSRGIGAAIVRRLARDGARVAFSYASSEARAKALEAEVAAFAGEAVGIQADQADERQAAAFVTAAHARLGRLDIVVNSAGITVGGKVDDPAADIAALKRMMAINLNGVVATVRAAAPLLVQGGRIVSIGSVAASHISIPGFADYVAAKAAVAAYTRGWARDLGPRGITVNAIQPGAINTESNPKESDFARALGPVHRSRRRERVRPRHGELRRASRSVHRRSGCRQLVEAGPTGFGPESTNPGRRAAAM